MKKTFAIDQDKNPRWELVRRSCIDFIHAATEQGASITIKISDVIRSLDQNAKMWPMLDDFAKQLQWPVNGVMEWLDADDWKALLTAAFQREARMAPGLSGGFVMLGARTSKFSRRQMAEFITFLYAEGSDRGVKWSEPSKDMAEKYGAK